MNEPQQALVSQSVTLDYGSCHDIEEHSRSVLSRGGGTQSSSSHSSRSSRGSSAPSRASLARTPGFRNQIERNLMASDIGAVTVDSTRRFSGGTGATTTSTKGPNLLNHAGNQALPAHSSSSLRSLGSSNSNMNNNSVLDSGPHSTQGGGGGKTSPTLVTNNPNTLRFQPVRSCAMTMPILGLTLGLLDITQMLFVFLSKRDLRSENWLLGSFFFAPMLSLVLECVLASRVSKEASHLRKRGYLWFSRVLQTSNEKMFRFIVVSFGICWTLFVVLFGLRLRAVNHWTDKLSAHTRCGVLLGFWVALHFLLFLKYTRLLWLFSDHNSKKAGGEYLRLSHPIQECDTSEVSIEPETVLAKQGQLISEMHGHMEDMHRDMNQLRTATIERQRKERYAELIGQKSEECRMLSQERNRYASQCHDLRRQLATMQADVRKMEIEVDRTQQLQADCEAKQREIEQLNYLLQIERDNFRITHASNTPVRKGSNLFSPSQEFGTQQRNQPQPQSAALPSQQSTPRISVAGQQPGYPLAKGDVFPSL